MIKNIFKTVLNLFKALGLAFCLVLINLSLFLFLTSTYLIFLVPVLLAPLVASYSSFVILSILVRVFYKNNDKSLFIMTLIFYFLLGYLVLFIMWPLYWKQHILFPIITISTYLLTDFILKVKFLNKFKNFKPKPIFLLALQFCGLLYFSTFIIAILSVIFHLYKYSNNFIEYVFWIPFFTFLIAIPLNKFIKNNKKSLSDFEKFKFCLLVLSLILGLISFLSFFTVVLHPGQDTQGNSEMFVSYINDSFYWLMPFFLLTSVINDVLSYKHKIQTCENQSLKVNKLKYLLIFSSFIISIIPLNSLIPSFLGFVKSFPLNILLACLPLLIIHFLFKSPKSEGHEEKPLKNDILKVALMLSLFFGLFFTMEFILKNIISSTSYLAKTCYEQGVIYKNKGWVIESKAMLRKAISIDAGGKTGKMAKLYLEIRLPNSDNITKEAIKHDIQGCNYWDEKKYEKAIVEFKIAIKESPEFEWPYIDLAGIYYEQYKNYDKAEELLKHALSLHPKYFKARGNLADLYFCKGKDIEKTNPKDAFKLYLKAQNQFKQATLLDPNDDYTNNKIKDLNKQIKKLNIPTQPKLK